MKPSFAVYTRKGVDKHLLAVIVVHTVPVVRFIEDSPMASDDHPKVHLVEMSHKEFSSKFARCDEDLHAIAGIYREHATTLGATPGALDQLGYIIELNQRTIKMATAAKTVVAPKAPVRGAKVTAPPAKTTVAPKGAAAPKAEKAPKEPKEKRPTVSGVICQLIMEGKLTDDQIFASAQKQFGLDDGKRGYVSWNRSHLKKTGQNPPDAIGGKVKAPKAETKAPVAKAPAKAPVKSSKKG